MFFDSRIKSIKPGDRVLEVGPGGTPHERSDVLLELDTDSDTLAAQRGYAQELDTTKEIVYYDGNTFPFNDLEFDYVICSHVLEHVTNPEDFLKEVFRVSKAGYFEYPLIYYDYLYNFDVHLNFLKFDKNKNMLYWMKKEETDLNIFKPIQKFYYETLGKGYDSHIIDLKSYLFQGFEWSKPFMVKRVKTLTHLLHEDGEVEQKKQTPPTIVEVSQEQNQKSVHKIVYGILRTVKSSLKKGFR